MKKYVCGICGYIYDEAIGIPDAGIAAGTKWEDLPQDWVCPLCGAPAVVFEVQGGEEVVKEEPVVVNETSETSEFTIGQMAALCSNLAKGAEKQYLNEESALFTQLADYFKGKTPNEKEQAVSDLTAMINQDLKTELANANAAAGAVNDRGAKRALVWSEKVTRILSSILTRYEKEGDAFLVNTNVFVCETCGFVYIGDEAPALCPICKVPSWKIIKIERGQ